MCMRTSGRGHVQDKRIVFQFASIGPKIISPPRKLYLPSLKGRKMSGKVITERPQEFTKAGNWTINVGVSALQLQCTQLCPTSLCLWPS